MRTKLSTRRKTIASALIVLFIVSIIPVLAGEEKTGDDVDLVVTVVGPPPDMGILSIDTEPVKGEVFVEGNLCGTAPQSREVEVGTYTVTFGAVAGYTTPEPQIVDVEADLITNVMGTYVKKTEPGSGPSYAPRRNKSPVAEAGSNQTVYVEETVFFNGSESYDPDGTIMSWIWTFGDGEKTYGETASHVYSEPGNYTVTLKVKDWRDAVGSDTCVITVREIPVPPPPPPPPKPAEFEISDLEITPDEVEPGDEVTISFNVTNTGEEMGVCTVNLNVDEEQITFVVTLDGGESEELEFEVSPEIEGIYRVEVDGLSDSFTVEAPPIVIEPVPRPAEFVVLSLDVHPIEIELEEETDEWTFNVNADVKNIGEEEGSHTVDLKIDGLAVDSETVTLKGGEEAMIQYEVTRGVGSYTAEVEGLTTSFTVLPPPEEPPFWMQPVYMAGILILILAVSAAIYAYWKGMIPSMRAPNDSG